MATDRTGSRRPRRGLTTEEARLWERVAETARPLKRRRARPPSVDGEAAAPDPSASAPAPEKSSRPARRAALPTPPRLPPLANFDQKEARQLAGGRLAIEARVDLHGLTQRQAHARLKSFLLSAQAKGRRRVLVITGKGLAKAKGEPAPFWESTDRGVLKRLVPQWLSEPEFRALVVGFTVAQPRHGGEGALYVRLRRPG